MLNQNDYDPGNANQDFLNRCHAYWDGLLSERETEKLFAERDASPEKLSLWMRYDNSLANLKMLGDIEPPASLADRIRTEISALPVSNVIPLKKRPLWKVSASVAAAVFLVAGLSFTAREMNLIPTHQIAGSNSDKVSAEDVALERAMMTPWTALSTESDSTRSVEADTAWLES